MESLTNDTRARIVEPVAEIESIRTQVPSWHSVFCALAVLAQTTIIKMIATKRK
jgi:hypothetical protein